jgi:hypothetical protein
MTTVVVNIAKLTIAISPGLYGCAISGKYIIAPKDALARSRRGGPYIHGAVHEYVTDHMLDESPFAIVEVASDLGHEVAVSDDQYPNFSDALPMLGEMLGVATAGYLCHPEPRPSPSSPPGCDGSLTGTLFLGSSGFLMGSRAPFSQKQLKKRWLCTAGILGIALGCFLP